MVLKKKIKTRRPNKYGFWSSVCLWSSINGFRSSGFGLWFYGGLVLLTFCNTHWVHIWSQYIKVQEGLSSCRSIFYFIFGNIQHSIRVLILFQGCFDIYGFWFCIHYLHINVKIQIHANKTTAESGWPSMEAYLNIIWTNIDLKHLQILWVLCSS